MAYPKQLITDLCKQLPEYIIRFFELEKRKYFQDYDDLDAVVAFVLSDYLKGESTKTEINSINNTQSKMRRQKKKRWMTVYEKALANPINTKKTLFFLSLKTTEPCPVMLL